MIDVSSPIGTDANLNQVPTDQSEQPIALPVALVGMHRSGTSMVARLLRQAGLNFGPDEALMPPAEENPEGFFEHLEFVRLNDEVLNAAGAGWDCPPSAEFDWSDAALEPFRERARSLASELATNSQWGWKDPRTTLLIPFWRSALGPITTVAVVRNPLEVVTSLHRRNGFSIALSLTLWRIYAERLLQDTTPTDRLVTHYDAYFLEPRREIARILDFLGLQAERDAPLESAAVPGLRHHRSTLQDLIDFGFPAEVIDIYRTLCQEAQWFEGDAAAISVEHLAPVEVSSNPDVISRGHGRVDLLRVENEALRRNNADFTAALREREIRITEVETALRAHEIARTELEAILRERDVRIFERNGIIQRRDHLISTLQKELRDLEAEVERLRAENASLSDRLAGSERALEASELHERELRSMLTGLQKVQLQRDAEIMGTLGSVLSRHSPGAPASIYHRRLVSHVRQKVEDAIPVGSRVLVATYGDLAMLQLGDRLTQSFPRAIPGVSADYTDISDEDAVAQLGALVDAGAEYLVVPSPALAWLANHPALEQRLGEHHTMILDERGVVTIYALGRRQSQLPV